MLLDQPPSYRGRRNIHITQIIQYRLPPAGLVSILHRISGVLLFLSLPFLLYALQESLASEESFSRYQAFLHLPVTRIFLLLFLWAIIHHICAGLRHLFMDMHWGISKNTAQRSACIILAFSGFITGILAFFLFGIL